MSITGIECAFVGRLGRDPELRHSSGGKPWLALSVGVGKDDELQWIKATVFNTKAEDLARTLHKGVALYIEGRDLRIDRWTGNDGKERAELKCVATRVDVLGQIGERRPPKPKAPAEADQAAAPARAAPVAGPADYQRPLDDAGGGRRPLDDVIPFGAEWR